MQWKIGGVDQSTGRPWELVILADDANDAAIQARHYQESMRALSAMSEPTPTGEAGGAALSALKSMLTLALLPLVFIAFCFVSMPRTAAHLWRRRSAID